MTQFKELFEALASPFDPREVKTLPKGKGMKYITARTAMNRLDAVLGPENWWDSYAPGENSVQCALTIRLPDGREVTKCDAGGYAGMQDQGDDDKSGYSDAFKRAAAKFGVARYLYGDGTARLDSGDEPEAEPEPAPRPANGTAHPRPQIEGWSEWVEAAARRAGLTSFQINNHIWKALFGGAEADNATKFRVIGADFKKRRQAIIDEVGAYVVKQRAKAAEDAAARATYGPGAEAP